MVVSLRSGTVSVAIWSSLWPCAGTVTLCLGWSQNPLDLDLVIGHSDSYEIRLFNCETLVAIGGDGLLPNKTGLEIEYSVVDEGAPGDGTESCESDTDPPGQDFAPSDFTVCVGPGDTVACFAGGRIENHSEMNWSSAQYAKLVEEQYRETDSGARMELLRQGQAVMHPEQPMTIVGVVSAIVPAVLPVFIRRNRGRAVEE
jgi:hypothetical protein